MLLACLIVCLSAAIAVGATSIAMRRGRDVLLVVILLACGILQWRLNKCLTLAALVDSSRWILLLRR